MSGNHVNSSKAAQTGAVRRLRAEGAEDLAAFDSRGTEPDLPFEDVVEDLRQRGKL